MALTDLNGDLVHVNLSTRQITRNPALKRFCVIISVDGAYGSGAS